MNRIILEVMKPVDIFDDVEILSFTYDNRMSDDDVGSQVRMRVSSALFDLLLENGYINIKYEKDILR